jgi:predicted cytidylate kinase
MKNKISLSGLAGSGKTSIGKMLANKLGYEFISIGNYSRKFAENKDMSINEFQDFCEKNPDIDSYLDKTFSNMLNTKDNLIIDYRLAHKFIDNCFNVFLEVSEHEAAKRLLLANRASEFSGQNVLEIQNTMNIRNNAMRTRFIELYETDFTDKKIYDLVVNTNNTTIEVITDIIIKKLKNSKT